MEHLLELAKERLLFPTSLSEERLFWLLGCSLNQGVEYSDLYFQQLYSEGWVMEDSIVKQGKFGVDQGVGVRSLSGERSALAFSDDLNYESIARASEMTSSIGRSPSSGRIDMRSRAQSSERLLYGIENPIYLLDSASKARILQAVDEIARGHDPRVNQVQATLSATYETILVMGSDGRLAADIRPLVSLFIYVTVQSNGKRGIAHGGGGGRHGYEVFTPELIGHYVRRAVDSALIQLEAIDAPAGSMTVVCGAGWPGILLHEAVGHGLEGDFNRKGTSVFSGLVGQQVAAKGVTIVDDGTLPGLRGSLAIDDEGNPSSCTTLIEDGIMKGFIHDDLSARSMGVLPTGNGRRESYAHEPLPRMTNTYMLNGQYEPQEIIQSVEKGIYAVDFSGGQVDITNGRFTFSATEAYLIENGRTTAPVKGATLIGNGPESLRHVSMVGNDLALDAGFASCGKDGQTVAVGVGQPTIRIDNMTLGGSV